MRVFKIIVFIVVILINLGLILYSTVLSHQAKKLEIKNEILYDLIDIKEGVIDSLQNELKVRDLQIENFNN